MSPSQRSPSLRSLTVPALLTAVLCAASYLYLPLPFTPIVLSLHTVAVNLIGIMLRPREAACSVSLYLIMGLIGLPVFAGGTAGPGKLFGPTGGFYFGFLAAAPAISAVCRAGKGKPTALRCAAATLLVGLPIQHLAAIAMMCAHNGGSIVSAAVSVSLPFIAGDALKCVISAFVGSAMMRAMSRKGR